MNVLNSKMFYLIFNSIFINQKLSLELSQFFNEGFVLINGCYFLKKLHKHNTKIFESHFIDKTGYESCVNSFHTDDYIKNDLFEQTILFSDLLIKEWQELKTNLNLIVIISQTDFGYNIKFHTERLNEKYINENELHKFNEAILIIKSNTF
jgi:hypothetical protein